MYQADKELTIEKVIDHPCIYDWRNRISAARKHGYFTLTDLKDAADWDYCAVGEAGIRGWKIKNKKGFIFRSEKLDPVLAELGVYFNDLVNSFSPYRFDYSLSIIDKIEDRLAILGRA